MVFGGHGDGSLPEFAEGRVTVEDGCVLRVDVEDVELSGAGGELRLNDAEELTKQRCFEWMEEEGDRGCSGEAQGEGILLEEADGGEQLSITEVLREGDVDVFLRYLGECRVEFDTEDFVEG